MKKLALFFLLAVTMNVQAQRITGCGFKVPPRSTFKSNFASVYEARDILNKMLDSVKWKENFSVREENGIRNAYATIIANRRWIIYDNDFLEDIDAYTKTKWSSISVLAHEMGHHYYNHVVSRTGSTPPKEIEADAFSGYVMHKLGANLNESVAAITAIATDYASNTHPAKKDRVAAITRGWNTANTEIAGNPGGNSGGSSGGNTGGNSGGNTGGNTGTNTGGNTGGTGTANLPPPTDPSWISLSMQSNKTETVLLSDDGKNYQAAEIKAGEPFVFLFEIYQYGWLKLPYYNGSRVYKLMHGKDYSILWNRRTNNWAVVEVPN
ncbi:MAG: M48 family metalloprotease [Chitinophagaceae bacterium]|nr:M48 family metalloprotease [Chitinophagaceae bacterium]